ncbi:MAG TPA: tetratricopeptide repeat protein [Terriglobales bacterium]|nr:tetratricopeptide repeat protein [Terriglobales bacterium]
MRAQTRHDLKEDRFSRVTMDAAEATAHWSIEHKNKVIAGAVIVLVVAAAAVGSWYFMNQQDLKASAELGQATRTLDTPIRPAGMPPQAEMPTFASSQERATAARKQFQTVVDNYPHTKSADFARYFIALSAQTLGDNATAESQLKTVASVSNDDLAALGNFALASVYRNTNRSKDAIAIYKKLIDKPTSSVSKVTAQLELGETYKASGQPVDAKMLYEQVEKENPSTPTAPSAGYEIAKQRLLDMK